MNTKHKTAWLEALRSGRYRQARRAFMGLDQHGVKHCCLAVLADVVREGATIDDSVHGLLTELRDETGLTREDCRVLARLNDGGPVASEQDGAGKRVVAARRGCDDAWDTRPWSYEDIAEYVEAEL